MAVEARDEGSLGEGGSRRRRRPRWAWVIATLLLLLVASGVAYWRWGDAAERRLARRVEDLRRQGQPVAPQDLVRPGVPGADNAAIDLRAAAALIDGKSDAWKVYQTVDFGRPIPPAEWEAVKAVLGRAEHRRALDLLRRARAKRGADWQLPMRSPLLSTLLPDLNEQRDLAVLALAAALEAFVRDDHAAAVEHLRDVLAIGRALDKQPVLVGHLVACTVVRIEVDLLRQLAPLLQVAEAGGPGAAGGADSGRVRPATPEQVGGLIEQLLDEASLREGLRQALRDERVLQLDTAQLLADGGLPAAAVGATSLGPLPMLPRPMILDDAALLLDQATAVLAAVERSPDWPTYRRSAPPSPLGGRSARTRHALAKTLLPDYDRPVRTHFQTLADRRMAAVALAVRWYASDHGGNGPRTLEELVPKYLPAVPTDPFALGGAPLRYQPGPTGASVYSVGENGTDDGGAVPPDGVRTAETRWEQPDAAFSLAPKPPPRSVDGE